MVDGLIKILAWDYTRGGNVVWGIDGDGKSADTEIILTEAKQIFWSGGAGVESRCATSKLLVRKMNQYLDENGKNWPVQKQNWREYVDETKLEAACGEAPFVVERFDESGMIIPLSERAGFLDRKLDVVGEYCSNQMLWLVWAKAALCASYGYDIRGDMVIRARRNVLLSFLEHWNEKFPGEVINLEENVSEKDLRTLKEIAEVVTWNIFQMDGRNNRALNGDKVKIMDWKKYELVYFDEMGDK